MIKSLLKTKHTSSWIVTMILLWSSQFLQAQIVCNSFVQYSTDANCEVTIDKDHLLEGAIDTTHQYNLEILDGSNPLISGSGPLNLPNASNYLGDTLNYVVTDITTGNSCWGQLKIEDKLRPVPICYTGLTIALDSAGQAQVWALDFNQGSYDNCAIASYEIVRTNANGNPLGLPSQSITFSNQDLGIQILQLIVTDSSGNSDYCLVSLTVIDPVACQNDTTPPVAICDANITLVINPGDTVILNASTVDEGSYDLCGPVTTSIVLLDSLSLPVGNPGNEIAFTFDDLGTHNVLLSVVDTSSNLSTCFTTVDVVEKAVLYEINIPANFNTFCGGPDLSDLVTTNHNPNHCSALAVSYNDVVIPLPNNCKKIVRQYTILDWCNVNAGTVVIEPREYINNNVIGDAFKVISDGINIYFNDITDTANILGPVGGIYEYNQILKFIDPVNCNLDTIPPVAICNVGVNVQLNTNGEFRLWGSDIDEGSYDLCSAVSLKLARTDANGNMILPTTDYIDLDSTDIGSTNIVLEVIDSSGNKNYCFTTVNVSGFNFNYKINVPAFFNTTCGGADDSEMLTFEVAPSYCNGQALAMTYADQVINLPNNCKKIVRTYTILDWCSTTQATYDIPAMDLDGDGINGDAFSILSDGNQLYVNSISPQNVVGPEAQIYTYIQLLQFTDPVDCTNDTIPPVAVCLTGLNAYLDINNQVTIWAADVDHGSYDACSNVSFEIFKADANGNPTTAASDHLDYNNNDIGVNYVILKVYDTAGNSNYCFTEVNIQVSNSNLACNDNVQVSVDFNCAVTLHYDMILEGNYNSNYPYTISLYDSTNANLLASGTQTLNISNASDYFNQTLIGQITDPNSGNSCWGSIVFEDKLAPAAVCETEVILDLNGMPSMVVDAMAFDDGSFDNCVSNLNHRISLYNSNTTPSPTLTFTQADLGSHQIMLTVDDGFHESQCISTLFLVDKNACPGDNEAPILTLPADTTVDCTILQDGGTNLTVAQLQMLFGTASATDSCAFTLEELDFYVTVSSCGDGSIHRNFKAFDAAGNISTGFQTISIVNTYEYTVNLPGDFITTCNGADLSDVVSFNNDGCNLLGVATDDQVFNIGANCKKIIRTYSIVNWCTYDGFNTPLTLERKDVDGNGTSGDAFKIVSDGTNIYFDNVHPDNLIGPESGYYQYSQILIFNENGDSDLLTFSGNVFVDKNEDCSLDTNDEFLEGWLVVAEAFPSGNKSWNQSDSNGNYQFINIVESTDTLIKVNLVSAINYGQACQSVFFFNPDTLNTDSLIVDFPVQVNVNCPVLAVDVSAPFLRRCFESTYFVNYCNYSTVLAEDAYIEVTFDSALTVLSSAIPWTGVNGNTYTFDVGDIAGGDCGNFAVEVKTDCNAILGQTHCTEAHIYPDTLCTAPSPLWTGASLEIEGRCENDSIYFEIKNVGNGPLTTARQYIIIEDVILVRTGPVTGLGPGQSYTLDPMEGKGTTCRLEVQQATNHPGNSMPSMAIEGCGTSQNGGISTGFVTMFPQNSNDPWISIDCQENIGSFDPNDKQAAPKGVNTEHYIEQNVDIEYKIRFQNTGTDTAFTVVVEDKLPEHLDASSIIPGASSHEYTFEKLEDCTMRFVFNDIELPDSSSNEAASHGFVKFRVKQILDNPIGTKIENTSKIYFDFNEAVQTNITTHLVGKDFLTVASKEVFVPDVNLTITPNPFVEIATFTLEGLEAQNFEFRLLTIDGKVIHQEQFYGLKYEYQRNNLSDGMYFFQIFSQHNQLISTGKILCK